MNYDTALTLLSRRYGRRDKWGIVRCADCGSRMDEHEMWCRCAFYAKRLTLRALREKGRA